MGFISDFKAFLMKGEIVNLATAVIVGGAFGKIVTSFTNDVLMPPIGLLVKNIDFKDLFLNLSSTTYPTIAAAKAAGAPTLNYGLFLNTILEFLIVAFAVFLLVRSVNRVRPAPAAAPATQDCVFCRTAIPVGALRCPHCTSDLKAAAATKA